jgi:hypothetical protein
MMIAPAHPKARMWTCMRRVMLGAVAFVAVAGAAGCGTQSTISLTQFTGCIERQSAGAVRLESGTLAPGEPHVGGDAIAEAATRLGGRWGMGSLVFPSGNDAAVSVWPSEERARQARDAYDRRYFEGISAYPTSSSMAAHWKVTDQFGNVVASYDHPPEGTQRELIRSCAPRGAGA